MPDRDNKPRHLKKTTTTHLKLVISNPNPVQGVAAPSQPAPLTVGFSVNVRSRGHNLYEMKIQDPFHEMECNLILEIERDADETAVVCHFPVILNDANKFLDEDEALYGIVAIQFQMNILEQLFIFCIDHDVSQLIIYMDDDQAEGFGIYQDFLIHCDETRTKNGEKTEMIIPTDQETFDKWRSFMAKTSHEFEQDLWREQRSNTAIRRYLKSRIHG